LKIVVESAFLYSISALAYIPMLHLDPEGIYNLYVEVLWANMAVCLPLSTFHLLDNVSPRTSHQYSLCSALC
jgi:hypothetical protein